MQNKHEVVSNCGFFSKHFLIILFSQKIIGFVKKHISFHFPINQTIETLYFVT